MSDLLNNIMLILGLGTLILMFRRDYKDKEGIDKVKVIFRYILVIYICYGIIFFLITTFT